MCRQSLWAACGRVIINEIVARRCIVAEPTTSPEQRDGELRNALEQIQTVMAVPALRCRLMSSCLACQSRLVTPSRAHSSQVIIWDVSNKKVQESDGYFVARFPLRLGSLISCIPFECNYRPRHRYRPYADFYLSLQSHFVFDTVFGRLLYTVLLECLTTMYPVSCCI